MTVYLHVSFLFKKDVMIVFELRWEGGKKQGEIEYVRLGEWKGTRQDSSFLICWHACTRCVGVVRKSRDAGYYTPA